ncbi:hypothetical protein ACJ73_05740 [Blastomyces percursus]|uniref:Uncharacterized protein n=1 Tax=Blastomyces percursus TaxID=1658174 RepID=A0A1J9Q498_9EURO|nr:hypothetical protein ACJ73_05740 [Blastomyces percursus]
MKEPLSMSSTKRSAVSWQAHKKFDYEEPLREIKRQLSGIKVSRAVSESLSTNGIVPPQQQRLISARLTLPRETLRDEMLRRTEAIDAVAAYCLFEEGDTCRLPHDRRPTTQALQMEVHVPPPLSQRETASRAVMKDHGPLYCFICLDKISTHG